jgi:hypothetical protein
VVAGNWERRRGRLSSYAHVIHIYTNSFLVTSEDTSLRGTQLVRSGNYLKELFNEGDVLALEIWS